MFFPSAHQNNKEKKCKERRSDSLLQLCNLWRCFVLKLRIRRAVRPQNQTCMAALFPPTEEALWGLAGATPRGHSDDSLARTRPTTSRSGTKREDSEDEGRKDTREKLRRRTSSRSLAVQLSARILEMLLYRRGPEDLTWRGSGAERKRAYVTNVTAAGRNKGKREKKTTHFCGFAFKKTDPP